MFIFSSDSLDNWPMNHNNGSPALKHNIILMSNQPSKMAILIVIKFI
jgi:hypothetical protein